MPEVGTDIDAGDGDESEARIRQTLELVAGGRAVRIDIDGA